MCGAWRVSARSIIDDVRAKKDSLADAMVGQDSRLLRSPYLGYSNIIIGRPALGMKISVAWMACHYGIENR